MKNYNTTLLIIIKNNRILLGQKKKGFAAGRFNGIGGKVEQNETVEQAMVRETQEEIGITPKDYYQIGTLLFDEYVKNERATVKVNVFIAKDFDGILVETEEMKPCWFNINNIPFDKMLPDDKYWYPYLLNSQKFEGNFVFDKNFNVVSHFVKEV